MLRQLFPATNVQFHYDYRGRRDWVQDQNGKKTVYAYDDADRLTSVTDAQTPTAGVTTYAYDTENNLTSVTDASGHQTTFTFDPNRRLSQTTFPSSLVESYAYDNNGNLTSKTDRKSNTIYYAYDALNRLTTKTLPDSSTVAYTYDLANRLTQAVDPTGTYTFSYDRMDRMTQAGVNYAFDTAGNLTVGYGYDKSSNRTSMTDPQSVATTYGYDVLNRMSTLSLTGQSFGFGYDDLSRRTSLTRNNTLNTSYTYDPVSRLLSVLHKLGTTTKDGATYVYDSAGNRTTRTDNRTSTALTYTYDDIYQLKTAKQGTTTKETYTYDAVGNRLSSLGVTPYSYNSSNELNSLPGTTYTYDNNGNTLTKVDGTGTTSYTWDYENRLNQVTLPGTGGTVTFKYDPFGRRVQKSFTQGATTTVTNYVYDGANVLEEVTNAGTLQARYTHSAGIDEPLAEKRGTTVSYYEADGLGSVTSLSNTSGVLANTYTYDAYGKLTASTGTVVNPFRYAGREWDGESSLYEYRARYYDSMVGRFISEDSISVAGGLNLYRYVDNQPSNYVDPSGLSGEDPSQSQADAVALGLRRLRDLLPGDPDCRKFLCHDGTQDPLQTLDDILRFRAFGVAPIPPRTDRSGNPIGITNALSGGYVVGQAITVNTLGAYFNDAWTTDRGKIKGGTPGAQGFILLHELSHLMNSIQPDYNNQSQVDRNDREIEKHCKKLINALGSR